MVIASVLAVWLEDGGANNSQLLMIFIGIAAFALLAQAVVMMVLAAGAVKAQKHIEREIVEIKGKLMPLIDKSHVLITDLTPTIKGIAVKAASIAGKVDVIAAQAEEISVMVREKVQEFGPTVSAVNETVAEATGTVKDATRKSQAQVTRVNGMVTSVLDATANMGRVIQHGITVPAREVSGIILGVKAGLDMFLNGSGKRKPPVYHGPVGTYEPVDRGGLKP